MRSLALLGVLVAVMASPADAQVRRRSNSGIPPGQLPPPGLCRVWYAGLPPGRQPRPTNCDEAERIASRDRNASVIYGDDAYARGSNAPYANDRYGNDRYGNDRYGNDRYGNDRRSNRGYGANTAAFDNGYRDGLEKGIEDSRDRDSYDPVRHSRYRSADHGYNSRYGTREQYKLAYRDGFEAGYEEAYRRNGGSRFGSRGANRWPF